MRRTTWSSPSRDAGTISDTSPVRDIRPARRGVLVTVAAALALLAAGEMERARGAEPAGSTGDRASPRPARPGAEEYLRLADELDQQLRKHLAAFYPRSIDREVGGFLEQFGPDWSPGKETGKFLVYQARMTWVAAEASAWSPELRETYATHALHGLRFLDQAMRDREQGGVYFRLDFAAGKELRPAPEKHAYGLSFAIYAGAAVFERTGDPAALALARDTFQWLDRSAHDERHGGYFESLSRDGKPVLLETDGGGGPGKARTDGIGTLLGYKSMNTHIHLLEAFTSLYRVWPDPDLRRRLEELLLLVRDTIAVEPGCLNLFFTRDWRAVPAHDSFGHDIETAYLLVEAAEALGMPEDERTWRVARRIVDHALDWGFDPEHGGFYDKGEAFAPAHDTTKVWWTQAEGLNALLLLHGHHGSETDRYWKAFVETWRFIREHQVDPASGGWFGYLSKEGKPLGSQDQATPWKAAYHSGRALMNCVRWLRELAKEAR